MAVFFAGQASFAQPTTSTSLSDIQNEISKYQTEFSKWVRLVSGSKNAEERAQLIKEQPDKDALAERLMKMSEQTDSVPARQQALAWIYIEANKAKLRNVALDRLIENEIPATYLTPLFASLERDGNERARLALESLSERLADQESGPLARLALATWLIQFDRKNSRQRAEKILESLVDSTKDARASNSEQISRMATARLFELNRLGIGQEAPNIEGLDLQGESFCLNDYRGKIVLLSFWAHWCGGCMEQAKVEKKLIEAFPEDPLLIVGVNGDVGDPKRILTMNEKRDITFRSFRNDSSKEPFGRIAKLWNVRSLPTTYLIGTNGVILAKWSGEIASFEELSRLVKKELNGNGRPSPPAESNNRNTDQEQLRN